MTVEIRSVMTGLEQIKEGKTKDFNTVCAFGSLIAALLAFLFCCFILQHSKVSQR